MKLVVIRGFAKYAVPQVTTTIKKNEISESIFILLQGDASQTSCRIGQSLPPATQPESRHANLPFLYTLQGMHRSILFLARLLFSTFQVQTMGLLFLFLTFVYSLPIFYYPTNLRCSS